MVKIIIKNKQGIETHGATFKTQAEADAWILETRSSGAWGKPSGVYSESKLSEQEKLEAIEILPEGDQHFFERQFQIQDQFTVEQVDISEEIKDQKEREFAEANEIFGKKFIREVLLMNKKKVEKGVFTLHTLDQMDESPIMQKFERACQRGAIPTLKYMIEKYNGPYFTTEEKAKLLDMVNKHLGM